MIWFFSDLLFFNGFKQVFIDLMISSLKKINKLSTNNKNAKYITHGLNHWLCKL